MELKDRLKELRAARNMSLDDVGEKIGVGRSTIGNYETGFRYPKKEKLEALADLFNVDLDYLTGRSDTMRRVSFDDDRLLYVFHKLNTQGKEKAIDNVEALSMMPGYSNNTVQMPVIKEDTSYNAGQFAASGRGVYIDGIPGEIIKVKNKPDDATFVIGVTGDSMEPTYYDGDEVYVKKQKDLEFNEIGLWQIGSEFFIKEYGPDGLRSHNPKYPVMKGTPDMVLIGKVLGLVKR